MSVAFYIDENVHRGITNGLRLRGVDVLTVQEDGRTGFRDPLILERATELERVLFSQDEDFLAEANCLQAKQINFAGVIYAHKLRVSVGDCIRDLEIIAKTAYLEELKNRVQYLPL
ncbi:DUF5615 family PIN-like protein [Anabaena minutissima FACHB-250]|nr:DUF5615 family PIN-like protein [Anabaena minutissima FACHB-250]